MHPDRSDYQRPRFYKLKTPTTPYTPLRMARYQVVSQHPSLP